MRLQGEVHMRSLHQTYLVVTLLAGISPGVTHADDAAADADEDGRSKAILEWMQSYAGGTTIRVGREESASTAEMIEQPVFRYSDVEREIPDATLWVWTLNGRPAAFQKVEVNAFRGGKQWTICFASLSEDPLEVEWSQDPALRQRLRVSARDYASTAPGVSFEPIPDSDPPADIARLRSLQIRRLTERFEGRLGRSGVIRVIPRPIFEYDDSDSDLPLGAIFGLTATGTNPDSLLLIESREDEDGSHQWEFAAVQMTTSAVTLALDDETVWERPAVANSDNVQPNWTFYFLSRQLDVPSD